MAIPDIHRLVRISKAAQQARGEAVTSSCDNGICEKGQAESAGASASCATMGEVWGRGKPGVRRTLSSLLSPDQITAQKAKLFTPYLFSDAHEATAQLKEVNALQKWVLKCGRPREN